MYAETSPGRCWYGENCGCLSLSPSLDCLNWVTGGLYGSDDNTRHPSSKKTCGISGTIWYQLCSPPLKPQDKRKKRNQDSPPIRSTLYCGRNTRTYPRRYSLQTSLLCHHRRTTPVWCRAARETH